MTMANKLELAPSSKTSQTTWWWMQKTKERLGKSVHVLEIIIKEWSTQSTGNLIRDVLCNGNISNYAVYLSNIAP